MDITLEARVRKILEALDWEAGGNDAGLTLTHQLELLIAPGASPYGEIVRPGRAFWIGTTAAIGAVVAIPTTAHMLSIYNNEPDGGRTYVIDWVAAQNVVTTAVAAQAQIIVNVGQIREAIPTDSGLTIKKLNGLGSGAVRGDTKALSILNATALPAGTGLAANWFPWGMNATKPGVAATPGYGLWAPVDGRMEVPPGRYFAMHVLANVVGETFVAFIGWHEKQFDLG
jgi:hypothetical protein